MSPEPIHPPFILSSPLPPIMTSSPRPPSIVSLPLAAFFMGCLVLDLAFVNKRD
nr:MULTISPECIES: hypothetical protein [Okeania]